MSHTKDVLRKSKIINLRPFSTAVIFFLFGLFPKLGGWAVQHLFVDETIT